MHSSLSTYYCDKPSVNLLTAALVAYGVRHVVSCPGARNAILAHNFHIHPSLMCHAVTDERSAGFIALGMALQSRMPVAVSVTSGSALLNLLPAVAEAYYRQIPLIIISADRPAAWIGQNDGQTLLQPQALQGYVATAVNLPESAEQHTWCSRLLHQALSPLADTPAPVHINVPLTEPLFTFNTTQLPAFSALKRYVRQSVIPHLALAQRIATARFPVLVMGQCNAHLTKAILALEATDSLLILPELISNVPNTWRTALVEEQPEAILPTPDLVIYVGGALIGKRLKGFLRQSTPKVVVRVGHDSEVIDLFHDIDTFIEATPDVFIQALAQPDACAHLQPNAEVVAVKQQLLRAQQSVAQWPALPFSDVLAFQAFGQWLGQHFDRKGAVHLANSTTVRSAGYALNHLYLRHHCNRGVNGIEGSISAAVGFNALCPNTNYCITGDLSFFYDGNALWNNLPKRGLRILLFNNAGGQIHRRLPGLTDSEALPTLVVAEHHTTAQPVAEMHGLHYQRVTDMDTLHTALATWETAEIDAQGAIIEVVTMPEANVKALDTLAMHYRKALAQAHQS